MPLIYPGSGPVPTVRMSSPKFKGEWIEPPALRRGIGLLREYRFILMTALPGSGKSRFMARLSSESQAALDICSWLTCSRDALAGSLASSIATTLVRSVLAERSATAAMLMAAGAMPARILITVSMSEIAAFSGEVILFLDDIGNIADERDWETLQQLIEEAPENLRIVMATRSTVNLKLAKLVNNGALLELVAKDFHLAVDQIADLVTGMGQARPDLSELRMLSKQTRGWVGGIRLLTRHEQPRRLKMTDCGIGALALQYFEEEVIDRLSDEARGALDTILLPHELRQELLIELSGDPRVHDYLAEYQRYGLLEKTTADGVTLYQPAPLLAAVTRQLSFLGAEEIRLLHERCCDWFEAQGDFRTAAAHAVDGGNIEHAIMLIEQCGMTMIAKGQVTELQQWLPCLPLDRLRLRPMAMLAVAWALSLLYRLDEALPLIAMLEEDILFCGTAEDRLQASIGALRVMHLSMSDDVTRARQEARRWEQTYRERDDWPAYVVDNSLSFSLAHLGHIQEAKLVLERAYLPSFYVQGPYAAIYSRCILGLIDLRDGQIRRAEANFSWALKAAEADTTANSTGAVMAAGLLAGARYERNDQAGVRRLVDCYSWWMHAHLFTDARFHAYRAVAREQVNHRQYRAAISTLEQVLDAGPSVRLVRVEIDVLAEKIQVALAQHDMRMANTYVRALGEHFDNVADDAFLRGYIEVTILGSQAHLAIILGSHEDAIGPLKRAIRQDVRGGWKLRAFHWAILLVRALWRSGQQPKAVQLMERLVTYAATAGVVRTILDGGPEIAQVLSRVSERGEGDDGRRRRHLRLLREAFDPSLVSDAGEREPDIVPAGEALTARELELIHLVKGGLTNRQIAARMLVSENTIKWHLKNVFEKVSVKKRAELAGLAVLQGHPNPPVRLPAKRVVSRPHAIVSVLRAMRDG